MMREKIKIILVDDEAPARNRLRRLLEDVADVCPSLITAEFATGKALVDSLELWNADLVLLDVDMPAMSGVECVQAIRWLGSRVNVVFVTAHAEFATDAFDVEAVDYLLKPVRSQRLVDALERVHARLKPDDAGSEPSVANQQFVMVNDLAKVLRIPVQDVLYLQAEGKAVTLQTKERAYVITQSLAELELRFSQQFARIHRGCLVNRLHLNGFENRVKDGVGRWYAVLKDWPKTLPVSRRQLSVVKEFRTLT